ncbi:MAG: hypothetical protein WAW62_04035 [Candidatus Saccharimonas aalborgensis]
MDYNVLLHFARSGGGGSSGGGGGDMGLAIVGYIPSYYLGKLVKKFFPRTLELIISAACATVFSIILFIIGLVAGGAMWWFMTLIIIGIWIGWHSAFFDVWDKLSKRTKVAKQKLSSAAQTDGAWNEASLVSYAQQVFMTYQSDWSKGDTGRIKAYATQRYTYHAYLLMLALLQLGRQNIVETPTIRRCEIIDIHDDANNTKDSFTVAIEATADDILIDTASNTRLFRDTSSFTEYWTFQRSQSSWLLDRIEQSTANKSLADNQLAAFAAANRMYYSLDMGWLFLPRYGQLLGAGKFGKSDVNNHVIGMWDKYLVQFYTLSLMPGDSNVTPRIVAQICVPKSYGGIWIRPKSGNIFNKNLFGDKAPNGYIKYEFEWPEFNKRYEVYATDADRLATFELLNPSFMAYLYDTDGNMCIEVTDNIIYLYKRQKEATSADYQLMLNIMQKAYKELQL